MCPNQVIETAVMLDVGKPDVQGSDESGQAIDIAMIAIHSIKR